MVAYFQVVTEVPSIEVPVTITSLLLSTATAIGLSHPLPGWWYRFVHTGVPELEYLIVA
jgi:hypothetical protein